MNTETTVYDGKLNNEQLGKLTRRYGDITSRVNNRGLGYDWVLQKLQEIAEGNGLGDGSQFPTIATIRIGNYKTLEGLHNAIRSTGYRPHPEENNILENHGFTISPVETEIELVVVRPTDLGFVHNPSFDAKTCPSLERIGSRGIENGLTFCPDETILQLFLQDWQPEKALDKTHWVVVVTEPIVDQNGRPFLYKVGLQKNGELTSFQSDYRAFDGTRYEFSVDVPFMFAKRKQSKRSLENKDQDEITESITKKRDVGDKGFVISTIDFGVMS